MSSFDTLKAAKSLQNAGFEVQQAEAVVGMVTYALSEGLATKDDVRELSSGLGALENKVVALDSRMDVLDSKISALDNKIDNSVAALESKILTLDNKIDSSVAALDTKISALDTKISALDTKIEVLDSKIGVLDSKFEALNAKIDTGLSNVTQKLVIYLGGIIVGVTTLLGVLSRIFPVVPAP